MSGSLSAIGGGSIGGIAQLLNALGPLFLGNGKTTGTTAQTQAGSSNTAGSTGSSTGGSTSSTTSTGSVDVDPLTSLFQTAMGNASDTSATDNIVKNIMYQSVEAFTPVAGQQNSSGIYNSTVIPQLAGVAAGQATNQAAQTVLNYKTAQQSQALQAAQVLGQISAQVAPRQLLAILLNSSKAQLSNKELQDNLIMEPLRNRPLLLLVQRCLELLLLVLVVFLVLTLLAVLVV